MGDARRVAGCSGTSLLPSPCAPQHGTARHHFQAQSTPLHLSIHLPRRAASAAKVGNGPCLYLSMKSRCMISSGFCINLSDVPLPLLTFGRWKRGSRSQMRRGFGGGADMHLRRRPRRPRGSIHQREGRGTGGNERPSVPRVPSVLSARLPCPITHTGCVHSYPRGSFMNFFPNHVSARSSPSSTSHQRSIKPLLPLSLPRTAAPRVKLVLAAAVGKARRRCSPRRLSGRHASAAARHPHGR